MVWALEFDIIGLLAGVAEQSALASALKGHNPRLGIHCAATLAELEAFGPQLLRRARLVAFATPVVVPGHILDRFGFGAYNFHPGPPSYPGWLPSHFAVYDGATEFGATAHRMIEQVDAGAIVGVERFGIPPHTSVTALEQLAYSQLAFLFWRLAKTLATQAEPLDELPIGWSGRKSTRKMITALCDIPLDIAAAELRRRIAAFGDSDFGECPTITLHGVQFRYVKPEKEMIEAPSIAPERQTEREPA